MRDATPLPAGLKGSHSGTPQMERKHSQSLAQLCYLVDGHTVSKVKLPLNALWPHTHFLGGGFMGLFCRIILGEAATSLYVFKQTATLLPVISVPGMAVIEI